MEVSKVGFTGAEGAIVISKTKEGYGRRGRLDKKYQRELEKQRTFTYRVHRVPKNGTYQRKGN